MTHHAKLEAPELVIQAKAAVARDAVLDGLAYYQLAVELDPTNTDALVGKIRTLLRIGDVEHAARTCDELRQAHETPVVWALHEMITTLFNDQRSPRHVNIGGGPFFNFTSWLNLEAVASPSNPVPATLSPTTTIAADDATIRTVYSSHAFEHLDDETVAQCLNEARRVLSPDGVLVIKLPDFDTVLQAWKNADLDYFSDATWNYSQIRTTWANKGVQDGLDSRASMIFCGFWNQAYGNHFAEQHHLNKDAYHGPAPCDADLFDHLKAHSTPWEIAKTLRTFVNNSEAQPIFNHRNAWSGEEFDRLLKRRGFRVLSTDAARISAHHQHIPALDAMQGISRYVLAMTGEHVR